MRSAWRWTSYASSAPTPSFSAFTRHIRTVTGTDEKLTVLPLRHTRRRFHPARRAALTWRLRSLSSQGSDGAMAINGHGISGSDPGGGTRRLHQSSFPKGLAKGPKQDRRTCKGASFRPVGFRRYRIKTHNWQRQSCSGRHRCLSGAGRQETEFPGPSTPGWGLGVPSNRSPRFPLVLPGFTPSANSEIPALESCQALPIRMPAAKTSAPPTTI